MANSLLTMAIDDNGILSISYIGQTLKVS